MEVSRDASRQQFGWSQNIYVASQFISKINNFSFITSNSTVRREKDQPLAEAHFCEQT